MRFFIGYGIIFICDKRGKRPSAGPERKVGMSTKKGHSSKGIFKLGFGLMRLPKLADGSIDIETTKKMVDIFTEGGGTYFDTAYVYDNGGSEEAFRKAVADRYPRDSYYVCTKMNAWLGSQTAETCRQQFYTSLERTGAGYFDFYLLHALQPESYKKYEEWGLWDFVKEQKEKGLIKHWGFSFHATPEILEELLTEHPDVDFIQLQINYADWNNPNVQSRECWEVARKHGVPVTIMEPIKGGTLADPPQKVKDLFSAYAPDASFASWAVRYAASLEGIITVLSGMSTIEQVEDNMSYMKAFKPLDEEEQKIIDQAREIIEKEMTIPCTACHYCTEGCPMSIPIPEIFKVANENALRRSGPRAKRMYADVVEGKGKASDCVACGQCEGACPQQLPIISLLDECKEMEG